MAFIPDTSTPRAVVVIGAGTMGAGIAQTFAESGFATSLVDTDAGQLRRARDRIHQNWQRSIAKARMDEATVESARSRLTTTSDLPTSSGVELVVEAVFEDLDVKKDVLRQVVELAGDDSIIASNTSSISITALASGLSNPERVIGMHFFNPVPVMKLVEIVRGELTSDSTVHRVAECTRRLGKTPVIVADIPGFVANRVLMPMINEAIFALAEGVADKEGIDTVMKLGAAHPMGPLALADLIGLDVCLNILTVLQRDLGEDKYRPAPLLRRMVSAGKLGQKSGEGFYRYDDQRR